MASLYETDGQPRYGQRVSPEELAAVRAEQGLDPVPPSPAPRPAIDLPEGPSSGWKAPEGGVSLERWSDPSARRRRRGRSATSGRAAAPPARRWRILVVGLVLMLLVPALLIVGAINVSVDWSGTRSAVVGDSGAVYLDQGAHAMLYSGSGQPTIDCTITSPEGAAVLKDAGHESLPYASFTASSAGSYTISCPNGTEGLIVGPPMRPSRLMTASLMVVGAFLFGIAGLAVTVVGISRMRRPRA